LTTIPGAFKFSAKLFEFKLTEACTFFEEKDSDPEIDGKMKTGFSNFLESLNLYLDQRCDITSADECRVKIYGSVTLENLAIACANNRHRSNDEVSGHDISVKYQKPDMAIMAMIVHI